MRKICMLAIVSILLLVSSSPILAEKKWEKKMITDPEKVWTISFSQNLHSKSAEGSSIYVMDTAAKKKKKVLIQPAKDGKTITVSPLTPYEPGREYVLTIQKSVRSVKNLNLREHIYMPFELKDASSAKAGEKTASSSRSQDQKREEKPSSLQVSVSVKEYISTITVKTDAPIKDIKADGRTMQYIGRGVYEAALSGVSSGDTITFNAYDFNGRIFERKDYLVK
ncbi:hypothetical protein EVU96_13070 [Bacillus infantis]|uniref:Ig-like domain-containing protein n=1 Tax=Bacillus infantis TaxID=324767 RepID=UPI00101C9F2A|nr:Ig-like domain-containing protein [Bacillus infantis]RYI28853.1 hypothetical protein EVU96_13070 [Bacillus infantis]